MYLVKTHMMVNTGLVIQDYLEFEVKYTLGMF